MSPLTKRALLAAALLAAFAFVFFGFPTPPVQIHDPSTIIWCGDQFWVYSTGPGVRAWHSADLRAWKLGRPVFPIPPAWTAPIARGSRYFWAPDIIYSGSRYFLYYAVSRWGTQDSAIGLATSPTLDPRSPDYRWTDRGIVIRSRQGRDNFNAIDPSVMLDDTTGRLWLAVGSFWDGIELVELDPATGLRKAGARLYPVARASQIEAPCLIHHGAWYYLFVNWGLCCRGVHSTYEIRVGRSASVTGPYLDKNGVDLRNSGGTLFLATESNRIGPGHAGLLRAGPTEWFSYHYYDAKNHGLAALGVRKLDWTADGWPSAGESLDGVTNK
jgi:arabinan endo-1,5-alpha-L-arabinosidase